jgi:hypothetical protein
VFWADDVVCVVAVVLIANLAVEVLGDGFGDLVVVFVTSIAVVVLMPFEISLVLNFPLTLNLIELVCKPFQLNLVYDGTEAIRCSGYLKRENSVWCWERKELLARSEIIFIVADF